MKLRYYGKGRNFNSIGCVKKRENSDRKNSYFFNLCSADFTMIVFFALVIAPQSIFQANASKLMKNCFLHKWSIGLKWIKHIQRKLTTTKHAFFFKNRQEQLMWQKIIISSCNKTLKQVISFLSDLLYLYFR